jgi:hypothetical protein
MPVSIPILIAASYGFFSQVRRIETPFAFSMRVWVLFTLVAFGALIVALISRRDGSRPALRVRLNARVLVFGVVLTALAPLAPHILLAAASSALAALLVPRDLPQQLKSVPRVDAAWSQVVTAMRSLRDSPIAISVALLGGYFLMSYVRAQRWAVYYLLLAAATWGVVAVLLVIFERSREMPIASHLRVSHPAYLAGLLLLLMNGLSPYLGLKTEHSFTMFSNLATEGTRWNHFVMPRQAKIFGMQDDLVQIVGSSDQRFRGFAARRAALPYLKFRTLMAQYPHIRISYERGGQRFDVPRVGDDPVLSQPPGWLVTKVMDFRPVSPRNVCRH